MKNKKNMTPEEEIVAEEEIVTEAEEKVSSVSVYNAKGGFIRTYSKEAHGKDFMKLAEGYAVKIGGTVK